MLDKRYHLELQENSQEVIQFLEEKIYDHNVNAIGNNDGRLFSVTVKDIDQNIVAGIAAWTWAEVCEITNLWVNENERGIGLGKKLLEAVEAEAKKRGCHQIMARSYSFQAPHFYQRHGYTVENVLNDFPQGHSYFFMLKRLEV